MLTSIFIWISHSMSSRLSDTFFEELFYTVPVWGKNEENSWAGLKSFPCLCPKLEQCRKVPRRKCRLIRMTFSVFMAVSLRNFFVNLHLMESYFFKVPERPSDQKCTSIFQNIVESPLSITICKQMRTCNI